MDDCEASKVSGDGARRHAVYEHITSPLLISRCNFDYFAKLDLQSWQRLAEALGRRTTPILQLAVG